MRCTPTRSPPSTTMPSGRPTSQRLRADYEQDIDVVRLAAELVVDQLVEPEELRDELIARLAAAQGKDRSFSRRRHGVTPV